MKLSQVMFLGILIVAPVLAQGPPWNEKGKLMLSVVGGGEYVPSPLDRGYWLQALETEFGQIPGLIIRDDVQNPGYVFAGVSFRYEPFNLYPGTAEDSVWWMDSLTWGEIQPHLIAVMQSTNTGDTTHFNLPSSQPDDPVEVWSPGGYTSASPYIPATSLPVPADGQLYKIWLEPVTGDLPWKHEVDTLTVVRPSSAGTPSDTLYWMYRHWNEATPAMFERMLVHFPDDTRLLRHFFWKYYGEANCDSLTRVGQHLIEVWQSGESGYMLDYSENFNQDQAIEDVQHHIEHICGGGQPDPNVRPLGRSQL